MKKEIIEMTTLDGHKAQIKIQDTPQLLTEKAYHISIFSKEKGKSKKVIHQQTCHAGPQLPELIVRGWTLPTNNS